MTTCEYMVMCDRPAVVIVDMSPVNSELPICQRCLDNVNGWAKQPATVVREVDR